MEELKNRKIWICWRMTESGSKETKKPISASGTATGTNNRYAHTWVTYAEVVKAVEQHNYSGVGFVIPDGYFFLDIDHRELNDPLVQKLIKRFNSYTELSVSGNGLHIYGKCDISKLPVKDGKLDKRFYMKNPNNGLELYIGGFTNRFAVYTENAVCDLPLAECTDAVMAMLEHDMRRCKSVTHTAANVDNEAEIFDLICSLRKDKNGEKFSRLFDRGDITGFNSHSEADCSLCAVIAFRTGNNPKLIDAIFRRSVLYRDKWERGDYREATIEAAVAACGGVFHKSVMPRPEYIEFNPKTGSLKINCPKLAKHIRGDLKYIFVRDNARSGVIKYVYYNGCYRLYSDDMLKGIIKKYITDYNENILKMSAVEEVFKQLITDLNFVDMDSVNADEDIINFQNGILRLSDMTLIPHSPDILSTVQISCNWTGTESPTPVFDSFLSTLTDNDAELQNLLLEFMGVCISNIKGWRMKKALFLYGKGDTGKSQIKTLTERLIGKGNYIGIDLDEIEARFGTANLYGKRLAGSSDMSFLSVDELKTFKKCTGGDSLFAEFKGQNGFEFTYNGLLWFCMNKLPKFGGDDGKWVYDRIIQIECKNVIPADKQDKLLLDKMYAERSGIVYKCVAALGNVIARGYRFSEPETVLKARELYMNENNTVVTFFKECMKQCTHGKMTDQCSVSKIYSVYKAWCNDNNHGYSKTAKEFRTSLADYLNTTYTDMSIRRNYGVAYKNYTLTDETKRTYSRAYGYDDTTFLTDDAQAV